MKVDSPTRKFRVSVGQLLQVVITDFDPSSIMLPPGIPNIFNIDLTGFSYNTDPKSITVTMEVAGDVSLIPGTVVVSDVSLTIGLTLAKPRKITICGNATWTIGLIKFQTTIERNERGKGFTVQASARRLPVSEVLNQFGATLLPDILGHILQKSGLNSFVIVNPRIQLHVHSGVTDIRLYLSGSPQIAGLSGGMLNSVVIKNGSKTIMAAEFKYENPNFARLLSSWIGIDVFAIPLFNQRMKAAFTVSPESITDASLQGLSIKRGLSLLVSFKFPDDCNGDLLCEMGKTSVGSQEIKLSANITSVEQIVITIGLADMSLGNGMTLSHAALEFQLGSRTSIGITGGLTFRNLPIQFQGAIRIGTQGLELKMVMVGEWKRPFGISYLRIRNLIISIIIVPGVPLSSLQAGGEVLVGDLDSGRELIGKCYVGFDPVNHLPYYYASINKASFKDILNAFGTSSSVYLSSALIYLSPSGLTESGFPHGILSSFAYNDIEPVPGVLIPAGFKLSGTINIFGYQWPVNINRLLV